MDYAYYYGLLNKDVVDRYDLTPLFSDSKVFAHLLTDLAVPFENIEFSKIAGIDALGFILGAAIAQKLSKGFVAIRKGGKLPGKPTTFFSKEFVDYTKTSRTLELSKTLISPEDNVLLVDDWIETGSQMKAAIELIESAGGTVVGITTLSAQKNEETQFLFEKYNLKAIHVQKK